LYNNIHLLNEIFFGIVFLFIWFDYCKKYDSFRKKIFYGSDVDKLVS